MPPTDSPAASPQPSDVLRFWFDDHAGDWFLAASPVRDAFDQLVFDRFAALVTVAEKGGIDDWFERGPEGATALVIVQDQFSRHIYRNNVNGQEIVARLNSAACLWTEKSVNRGDAAKLRGPLLSFLLMPWRHEQPVQVSRLERILDLVSAEEERAIADKAALSRFKRVTEAKLAEAPASEKRVYTDQDVLEIGPLPPVKDADPKSHIVYGAISKRLVSFLKAPCLIVSLSGGVDSMVITYVLSLLRYTSTLGFVLAAAHVNYGNRGASDQEADFVRRWCEDHSVRFFCKRVGDQVLRGVTERDEYEAKSRQARFDLYKHVWTEELGQQGPPVVLLGHHRDDVTENVLSNAMKGRTILELSGMKLQSNLEGCLVCRPLLELEKAHIFDFAHTFGVPYFKDTTPRWSTRGQVRNEVLPLLSRVYGKGWRLHLANLAKQSDELDEASSEGESLVRARPSPAVALCIDMAHAANRPLFLWRLALRRAAHAGGVLAPRDKAVTMLVERLAAKQQRESNVEGTKETSVELIELRSDVTAFIVEARFLVVAPASIDGSSAKLADLGSSVTLGPWSVELVSADQNDALTTDEEFWNALVLGDYGKMGQIFCYKVRVCCPGAGYSVCINARDTARRRDEAWRLPRLVGFVVPLVRAEAIVKSDKSEAIVRCRLIRR